MEREIMTLTKKDGSIEEIEILMTFKIEKFNNSDYVFYKSNNEYYAAKFLEKDENTELITDLTTEEEEILTELFDKMREGEIL